MKHLKKSYKMSKEQWLKSIGLDVLFYILVLIGISGYLGYLDSFENAIPDFDPTTDLTDTAKLEQTAASLDSFVNAFYFGAFLLSLYIVICWSIIKGLIWMVISQRKVSGEHVLQYGKLTFIWMYAFFLLGFGLLLSLKTSVTPYVFLGLIVLFGYFSLIVYAVFSKKLDLVLALQKGFALGITKVHRFILPYIIIIIVYIIISLIFFQAMASLLPGPVASGLSFLVTLAYVAWVRHYIMVIVYDLLGYKV